MSDATGRLLVVDDDEAIRAALVERFRARGHDVREAASGREALAKIRQGVDVVLLDLQIPEGDGMSVLQALQHEEGDGPTVIVLTAHGSVDRAVQALKLGAYDFLEKPFEPTRVEEALGRALERGQLLRARAALEAERPDSFVHATGPMEDVVRIARKAAGSDATILLGGESGTGKEVLARAIHRWSPRSAGPFVAVHCAAMPDALVEAELFGHEKGAFTGADKARIGRFESAHHGTLFLDEVGELPAATQVKLLRVLQERTFERVGGNEEVHVDLRLLAATNRDLKEEVKAGRFREDLYYRLNVISVSLPPLKSRGDDLLRLAETLLADCASDAGRPVPKLAPETVAALRAHDWPGNVRELRNALERAVVLGDGKVIVPEDLPPEVATSGVPIRGETFHELIEAFRGKVLSEALANAGGNRTNAARTLGLQRTYLARLIKRHGLVDADD